MFGLLIAISTFTMVVCCHFYNKSLLEELNLRLDFIRKAELYMTRDMSDIEELTKNVREGDMKALMSVLDDMMVFGAMMENKVVCMDLFTLKKRCDVIMYTACGACVGNAVAMFII